MLELEAGAVGVVVRNREAFVARYGEGIPIIGEFPQSRLNNGGETIALALDDGTVVHEVAYDDAEPWPVGADGEGFSLELVGLAVQPSQAEHWRASAAIGGSPGQVGTGDGPPPQEGGELQVGREQIDGLWYWVVSWEGASSPPQQSDDLVNWREMISGWEPHGDALRSTAPIDSISTANQLFFRLSLP